MMATVAHPRTKLFLRCCLALNLSLILSLLAIPAASAKSCIDWPRVMAEAEVARQPAGRTVIVQPFTDFAKVSGDEWLANGLRDYVVDLLRSASDLRVLSNTTAGRGNAGGTPDFTVSGTYQHFGNQMRIFIRLNEGGSAKLLAQPDASFPYPENQEFFSKIAAAVQTLFPLLKASVDQGRLQKVRDATASTRAYENFARGRQELETWRMDKLSSAAMLFNEAKRIDYRSPLGYEGLAAAYTFAGLVRKQGGEGLAAEMQRAEAELLEMQRLTRTQSLVFAYTPSKAVKRESVGIKLDNRFLAGEAAYVEGMAAQQAGNLEGAAEALRRATQFVPEDALAWYRLSRIESQLGRAAESQQDLQKAYAINSCVEQ